MTMLFNQKILNIKKKNKNKNQLKNKLKKKKSKLNLNKKKKKLLLLNFSVLKLLLVSMILQVSKIFMKTLKKIMILIPNLVNIVLNQLSVIIVFMMISILISASASYKLNKSTNTTSTIMTKMLLLCTKISKIIKKLLID